MSHILNLIFVEDDIEEVEDEDAVIDDEGASLNEEESVDSQTAAEVRA